MFNNKIKKFIQKESKKIAEHLYLCRYELERVKEEPVTCYYEWFGTEEDNEVKEHIKPQYKTKEVFIKRKDVDKVRNHF